MLPQRRRSTGRSRLPATPCLAALLALGLTLGFASHAATRPLPDPAPNPVRAIDCLPQTTDFTLLWWANGWLRGQPREPAMLCLQTGRYGAIVDPWRASLTHLGPLRSDRPYDAAAAGDPDRLLTLPPAGLELMVRVGGREFRCVRAATHRKDWMNFPVRIIANGRFLQRFDILQLEFESDRGERLDADGRLEILAWPEELRLLLEITPRTRLTNVAMSLRVTPGLDAGAATVAADAPAGQPLTAHHGVSFGEDAADSAKAVVGTATALSAPGERIVAEYEPARGWHRIVLPERRWSVADHPDRLERFRLAFTNLDARPRVIRLLLDDPTGTPGITGVSPMLRETDGTPTGIPVQISKNWHRQQDRRLLYEGPWLHAVTRLQLPAHAVVEAEFALAWARWGGVPAASHAQLCLIGWGWNQLWDEVAIGSWGESICYEPDAIQKRCRIDDVRPLLVAGMGESRPRWTWTHNVGGGDFLVLYDDRGEYQPWRAARTAYRSQGPNLTDVVYTGITAGGGIACRVEVSTPRTDDVTRAYHRLRYDVLKRTSFTRLAFYQLGSDEYHWHQYNRLARGHAAGLVEEWEPGRGGKRYLRTGIPCDGDAAWFSLHDGIAADGGRPVAGGWATRGLILRSWKARLGGHAAPPFAAVYGTEAGGIPSAGLELSPPPGLDTLEPGDFVECLVELVVLPMAAADYYGPNENLRASLVAGANTWRPVQRLAAGNHLRVVARRGTLTSACPPALDLHGRERGEIEIHGGVGWLPIRFAGLPRPDGFELLVDERGARRRVDQSVHGSDFWQTDYDAARRTWQLTFNVPLDTPGDHPERRRFILRPRRR